MYNAHVERAPLARPSFGRWLLSQRRDDAIGRLADAARRDPGFPSEGDFRAISARLNLMQAEGEMHEALEDAELDWASF